MPNLPPHGPVSLQPGHVHRIKDHYAHGLGATLHNQDAVPDGFVADPLRHPVKHGSIYRKLRRANVKHPAMVLNLSRRFNLPVALVVAVHEQETGIPQRNIFGCDWGSTSGPPYCNQSVTNDRVRRMQQSGKANGVGWPQLTWPPFVVRAMKMKGGAVKPKNQCVVGCSVLRQDINIRGSIWGGLELYNGSAAYANEVVGRYRRWVSRLT